MGNIIDLQQSRNRVRSSKEPISSSRSREDLAAALSACQTVRRQIGAILEVTIAIEEVIERQVDLASRRELLARLWTSRKEFIAAFESVSTTIEVLSRMTSSPAGQATTPPEAP